MTFLISYNTCFPLVHESSKTLYMVFNKIQTALCEQRCLYTMHGITLVMSNWRCIRLLVQQAHICFFINYH